MSVSGKTLAAASVAATIEAGWRGADGTDEILAERKF